MANSSDWMQGIGAALKTAGQLGQAHIQDQRAAARDERMFQLQERQLKQALALAREKNAMMTQHLEKTLASNEKVAGINAETTAEQGRLNREHETNIANIEADSRVRAAGAKGGDLEAVTTTGPDGSETTKYFRRDGDTLVEVPMATQEDLARAEELRAAASGGGSSVPAESAEQPSAAPSQTGAGASAPPTSGRALTGPRQRLAELQAQYNAATGRQKAALSQRVRQAEAEVKRDEQRRNPQLEKSSADLKAALQAVRAIQQ